jgi:DNA-binding SARP family transcriptional activator
MARPEVQFHVLGGVEALRNGTPVKLGGPRQRALLALLLVAEGKAVPADRLIDELWHGEPPAGAAGTLQSYVSRLRSALAADGAIVGTASAYTLDVDDESVDARRFERLVDEGHAALERDASKRALDRFQAALALWKGAPFGDVGDEGSLRAEAERLADLNLRTREGLVTVRLRVGAVAEVIDELESLVAEHPYRERLWYQLMLALYRAGRQADALAAYRRARKTLDELGLEPGDELRQLEGAILRHEVPSAPTLEERHNLPAPASTFFGRVQELEELEGVILASRLVTLTGVGGVGKTRLALEAARRVLPDFPEVVFVDLSTVSEPSICARRAPISSESSYRSAPRCTFSRRAASSSGATARRSLRCLRSKRRTPSTCSSRGLVLSARVSPMTSTHARERPRSAPTSTGCRSRSSLQRRERARFRSKRSKAASRTGSGSSSHGAGWRRRATRRSNVRWTGATSFSHRPSKHSSHVSLSSPAASLCRPLLRSASRPARRRRSRTSSG